MSKYIFIDVDGTLISKDKTPRPYFHLIIDFCIKYNVDFAIWSANGKSYVEKVVGELFPQATDKAKLFGKEDKLPFIPSYVIDDDEGTVRKYGGFCVPYYNPQLHNNFQCVMLTGRVLEGIMNFIRGRTPSNDAKILEDKTEASSSDPAADFGMSI